MTVPEEIDLLPLKPTTKVTWPLVFSVATLTLGGSLQLGYHIGNVNTLIPIIKTWLNESHHRRHGVPIENQSADFLIGLAISVHAFCGFLGASSMGLVSDKLGRRYAILFSNLFNIAGAAFMTSCRFFDNFYFFLLGRGVLGYGGGFQVGLVPIFLSELAPRKLRGSISSLHMVVVHVGIVIAQVVALPFFLGTHSLWTVVFGASILVSVLQCLLLPFCIESPKYTLCIRGREQKSEADLKTLRGVDDVSYDLDELRTEALEKKVDMKSSCFSLPAIFQKRQRWSLIVSFSLMMGQQMSGVTAVALFGSLIFQRAGVPPFLIPYAVLCSGIAQATVLGVHMALVDHPRVGRKPLVLIGFVGMLFSLVSLALSVEFSSRSVWISRSAILFSVLVTAFCAIGPNSIPYVYTAEIFTSEYRASAMSFVTGVKWLVSSFSSATFLPLFDLAGVWAFSVFVAALVYVIFFCWYFMVETKGRTPTEARELLEKRRPACL